MDKKIKVLFISHMYPRENAPNSGIFVHEQAKAFVKQGIELRIVSPIPYVPFILQNNKKRKGYRKIPPFRTIEDIRVYYPHYLTAPGKFFHGISCYTMNIGIQKIVTELFRDFKPDILHSHMVTPDGYAGFMLGKKFNLPVVCSLRGGDIDLYPYYKPFTMRLTKMVIAGTDQLVAVSNNLATKATSLAAPKNKIQAIHNGCDLQKFTFTFAARLETRNQLGFTAEDKILLFIGSLQRDKGIYELITSFSYLSLRYPDLYLIIVGDGPEQQLIKKKVAQINLQKRIYFAGQIPHSKIPEIMSAGDIFVLPSYFEGFPNVVKEAMACSRPVIATRIGGIPEIVENGETGLLINPQDVKSLTDAAAKLVENKELCARMGSEARKIVEQKFSWEHNVEEHIRIYERLIHDSQQKNIQR